MIKSNLLNPLKKQSKPQPGRFAKNISLADVGLKLQTTSISEVEYQEEKFAQRWPPKHAYSNTGQEMIGSDAVTGNHMQVDGFGSSQVDFQAAITVGDVRHHVSLADLVSQSREKNVASVMQGDSENLSADCLRQSSTQTRLVGPGVGCDFSMGSPAVCGACHSASVHDNTQQKVTRRLPLSKKQCLQCMAATPSSFALTVCFSEQHTKPSRGDKHAISRMRDRFRYKRQMAGSSPNSQASNRFVIPVRLFPVIMFDFSTPSPDDLVREKQIQAFKS